MIGSVTVELDKGEEVHHEDIGLVIGEDTHSVAHTREIFKGARIVVPITLPLEKDQRNNDE